MVSSKKCPIVDNLTVFPTLTAQTFFWAKMGKIPKGVVRAKILGKKTRREKKGGENSHTEQYEHFETYFKRICCVLSNQF